MRLLPLAAPMMIFTLAASAQTIPSAPSVPTEQKPTTTMPSVNSPTGTSLPGSAPTSNPVTTPSINPPTGTSLPGTAPTSNPMTTPSANSPSSTSPPGAAPASNPIDKAKVEAECKIPTNATKPECVELMLKKN